MPRGDGTGPMGIGPMTGRGMGYCSEYKTPGYTNAGYGVGCGRKFRRAFGVFGFGRRRRFSAHGAGRMRWY